MIRHPSYYAEGRWVDPSTDKLIEIVSPHAESVVGAVPDAAPEDVDRAVRSARCALENGWASTSPAERSALISALARELESRADEIARLQVLEMGCPVGQVRPVMVDPAVALLDYYARLAANYEADERRVGDGGIASLVRRKPVGVVAGIIPWNAPSYLTMLKLGPALVTGCSIVIKSAPEAPLSLYPLAEAAMAVGLPAGVLNVVPGGREAGEYLVNHPSVDKVSFTGSVATGRRIAERAGQRLMPVTLELGGKSAAIVLDDADLATTVNGLALNCFVNSGQVCGVDSRVLVPRSRAAEFTEALAGMVDALPVGDPFDPATVIGPMVSQRQRDKVLEYIRTGVSEGARLVTGGGRPDDQPRGWYVNPTLFDHVRPEMVIAQEEIFGPVVSIIAYDDENEALAIANGTDYGLAGSIWTADVDRAVALSSKVETGILAINGFGCQFSTPFGGVKSSGLGREMGPESLEAYIQYQSVLLPATPITS